MYVKALNPAYAPYDAPRLCNALLYNMYAPSLQYVSEALHKQLLCLPSSLSLTLDRWNKPGVGSVFGCSFSFIDDDFIMHSYVLGLTPLAEGIDIVPYAIAKTLAAIGPITCADCYAMVSHNTADARTIAKNLGLPMVGLSVDDVVNMLQTVNSGGGSTNVDSTSSMGNLSGDESVLTVREAIERAKSVVNYFLTSPDAMELLCVLANNTVHINLVQMSDDDHSQLFTCLSRWAVI